MAPGKLYQGRKRQSCNGMPVDVSQQSATCWQTSLAGHPVQCAQISSMLPSMMLRKQAHTAPAGQNHWSSGDHIGRCCASRKLPAAATGQSGQPCSDGPVPLLTGTALWHVHLAWLAGYTCTPTYSSQLKCFAGVSEAWRYLCHPC